MMTVVMVIIMMVWLIYLFGETNSGVEGGELEDYCNLMIEKENQLNLF